MVRPGAVPSSPPRPAQRRVRPPHPVSLGAVTSGDLLIASDGEGDDGSGYRPAPLLGTDVRIDVSGMVARTTVVQRFYNPSQRWVDATYVFPLPDGAAVDGLRLKIGDRFIDGIIEERNTARRRYDQATRDGKRAALLEQHRPNLFTNRVATIGPGEEVVVRIDYQDAPRYDAGRFSLRFPMVVGPRYREPGQPRAETVAYDFSATDPAVSSAGRGWAGVDAGDGRVAPVRSPTEPPINPVLMTVTLDPGFALAALTSPSHAVAVERPTGTGDTPAGARIIRFADGPQPADRDFVLEWQPAIGAAPRAGLFEEIRDGERYQLVMVLPPDTDPGRDRSLPREVVFVIDCSGSMSGPSIDQAKRALGLALRRLRPTDRFNLIQFSDHASSLFPAPRPARGAALQTALYHASRLHGSGGTNLRGALVEALDGDSRPDRVRQVIFLTDGAVADDAALMRVIHDRRGDSRLFTVGIGSAPNSWFMRAAAEEGRGSHTHIGDVAEVGQRMTALFAKLEHPVLTDIEVTWETATGDPAPGTAWPRRVPDLYRGEPVLVAARPDAAAARVVVRGHGDGRPWQTRLDLPRPDRITPSPGVATLWARRRITAAMAARDRGDASEAQTRDTVLPLALRFGLVSSYTSLVAIDVTPARPATADPVSTVQPLMLPAGWDFGAVFGFAPVPRVQWHEPLRDAAAPGRQPPASVGRMAATVDRPVGRVLTHLPQAATPAALQMLIGLLVLVAATALLPWRRQPAGGAA